jgi:hypothetical protein
MAGAHPGAKLQVVRYACAPVHSLARDFKLPGGQQWRTGMNNTPVFIVNTPEACNRRQR